jgi:V8-like Glu-specific endopeptidase
MERTTLYKRLIIGMLILMGIPALASAQTAELPSHIKPHQWNSAVHNGESGRLARTILAERYTVRVPAAQWLRLRFEDAHLGTDSFITITSLKDGAFQYLDAISLQQWQSTSAYFNGDALEIQLYVGAGDKGVFVKLKDIIVGDVPTESQCGPTDDRVPSNNPAAGRLLSIGCTAWIISNGLHVTAGHCSSSSATTLEFNVPPSLADGTIQHPPPQDQYSVNPSSKVYTSNGIGDDWGVFQVYPNSVTGLMPIAAQGASFTVVQNLGAPTIRVTGFGVDYDDDTRNQTQQTHAGPNVGSSGTTMRYQTDTEGGNSGSPVIDDATGNAVGVHTHGGCSTSGSGNNSGTATTNTAFWNAMNQAPPPPPPPATITVTSPNGGENWQIGTTHTITWTSSNVTGNVKIQIARDGEATFTDLFANTANDGSETWTVTGPATTQALIKITSLSAPTVTDQSNAVFTISDAPPQPPGGCPATKAAQGTRAEAETLALLYRFRDQVLAETSRGQQYTRLFYQFSNEMVGIMLSNPSLLLQAQRDLERFTPVLQAIVDRSGATVRQADMLEIERLLSGYAAASSPALRQTLEQLKRDVRDPRVQAEFGVKVSQ